MAKYKKGESGNPSGRPKLSAEDKVLKQLTKAQFTEIANLIVQGNWTELNSIERDAESSVLKKLICKALMSAYERGDWSTVDRFLDRVIGKVKDEVEATVMTTTFERLDGSAERYSIGPKGEEDAE